MAATAARGRVAEEETLAVKRQRLQAHAERIAEHNKAVRKARG